MDESEQALVWRVKFYQLDAEGVWDDQGTGDAQSVVRDDTTYIIVMNEENTLKLLDVPIREDENYERQQDSIIMWREPTLGVDCALSFQEVNYCEALWQTILSVQRAYNTANYGMYLHPISLCLKISL